MRFQTKCADGIKCENDYGNEMAIARQGKQLNYLATAPQHYGLLSGGFLSVVNLFLALKQGAAGTALLGVVWSVHFVLQSEDPVASLCLSTCIALLTRGRRVKCDAITNQSRNLEVVLTDRYLFPPIATK